MIIFVLITLYYNIFRRDLSTTGRKDKVKIYVALTEENVITVKYILKISGVCLTINQLKSIVHKRKKCTSPLKTNLCSNLIGRFLNANHITVNEQSCFCILHSPYMSVSVYDILVCGKLTKPHRTSCMESLR